MLLQLESRKSAEYFALKGPADDALAAWRAAEKPVNLAKEVNARLESQKQQLREQMKTASKLLPRQADKEPPKTDPETAAMVERLRKTHVSRCNHRLVSAEHHIVLARCATQGDWRTALWVYELGASKHIRPSMPATFSTLLLACKNADPPESAATLPLLEEVEAQGHAVTRELYHSAIDVCRAAGHWRRALQIFNRMSHQGLEPTTHTYTLLEQAGAAAKVESAAEVYDAMKFAGVPAYLSYTAAAANALNRTAADEGPVADWIGADLLPERPPDRMLNSVALYEGRAITPKAHGTGLGGVGGGGARRNASGSNVSGSGSGVGRSKPSPYTTTSTLVTTPTKGAKVGGHERGGSTRRRGRAAGTAGGSGVASDGGGGGYRN
mmetsp:Transcript_49105/g.139064  ORF Transcript_49105/g.139064 Transcript_49105/m.139064 type:complete len:382 (+) Transcript_49105:1356-2501(+)